MKSKRQSRADPARQTVTHHVRLSPEAIFYLQCVASHDRRTQGELIEQWARKAYAWRCYSGKMITITGPMKTSVRRIMRKQLELENKDLSDMSSKYDRLPIYSKPYYYLRRAWESTQICLANVALALKSVLLRLTRINKRRIF
jgi:hypothetical protein